MEGSGAERRYEENGKECGQRRKDVSWSRGEDEVVGLSTGWAKRAQCSLELNELSREGQREPGGLCNRKRLKSSSKTKKESRV